jgi:uncharacterized protein (DUF1015 family)
VLDACGLYWRVSKEADRRVRLQFIGGKKGATEASISLGEPGGMMLEVVMPTTEAMELANALDSMARGAPEEA